MLSLTKRSESVTLGKLKLNMWKIPPNNCFLGTFVTNTLKIS